MKKTKNILGVLALIIFVVGSVVFLSAKHSVVAPSTGGTSVTPTETNTSASGSTATTYTLADVAAHNSQASCWTTIGGSVYDLTTWISQHPGGEGAILSICGIDGTNAFMGQHGDNRRANQTLATFKIGTLKS